MQITEAFHEIAKLASALGVKNINELPGCWEYQVDDQWWFAVNGHREEVEDSKGCRIPPFDARIEYNGWPAGLIGPDGGMIAAGEAANEDTFIKAIQAATKRAEMGLR